MQNPPDVRYPLSVILRRCGRIRCHECRGEIYEGEEVFYWEFRFKDVRRTVPLCPECFDAYFDELSRYEKAKLLEVEIVRHTSASPDAQNAKSPA